MRTEGGSCSTDIGRRGGSVTQYQINFLKVTLGNTFGREVRDHYTHFIKKFACIAHKGANYSIILLS